MALKVDLEDLELPAIILPPDGPPVGANQEGERILSRFPEELSSLKPDGTVTLEGRPFRPVRLCTLPQGELLILVEMIHGRRQDLLISQISHEIRTPLSNIIGMSEMCLMSASPNRRWLECIREASGHLLRIANDLLDLSEISGDRMALKAVPYDLRKLVANTTRFVAPMAESKGIMMLTRVSQSVPELVNGDQDRVRQILLNLLTNAIKFSDRGMISVEAEVEDQRLAISVIDSGRGIPEDQQDKVFLPFYQASPEDRDKGRGLGLAICKKLAESMGGTMALKSAPGEGSTFTLYLPLVQGDSKTEQGGEEQVEDRSTPKLHILLAEDDNLNRELVEAMLVSMGHQVTSASTGIEALNLFLQRDFHLAILDVNMPDGDGVWLAKEIRRIEARKPARGRIPIMALTACVMEHDKRRCLDAGMDLFLTKPVSVKDLQSAIDRLFSAGGGSEEAPEAREAQVDTSVLSDMAMGQVEVMERALTLFKEGVPLMLETLRMLLHRRDLTGAASVVHKLKGRFATVGHWGAREYLAKLEEDIKAGASPDPDGLVERVEHFAKQVIDQYERIGIRAR
jgi:signal transduction histidine kinase/DNA-binding response OmpR family regulator